MSHPSPPLSANPDRTLFGLIGLNIAVFVLWQSVPPDALPALADHLTVSWDTLRAGRVWTLLTSAISHHDATHLLFNMIALWVFGQPVLRVLGERRFAGIYVVGALFSSVGYVAFTALAGTWGSALGASGAVMAIAVIFAALFPKVTLLLFFFVPVPAALAVALYIAADLWGLGQAGTGIAHAGHLGGAAYGLAYYVFVIRPRLMRVSDGR